MESARSPEILFVYGTLLSGGGRDHLMAGCRRLGETTVAGRLFDLGAYPALVLGGADRVHGELWSCPPETLPLLDSYEAVEEGLFDRVRADCDTGPCWTYVAGPRLEGRLTNTPQVAGGIWRMSGSDPRS
jgi:gamma-glutamylcyclotransferase (GGCT)/AIG2-like uncharacterized protein YtfP